MGIICIERVLVAVTDLDAACDRWSSAGFAIATDRSAVEGLRFARLYAGAVAIELCAVEKDSSHQPECFAAALSRGGGILGWTWGIAEPMPSGAATHTLSLPALTGRTPLSTEFTNFLPGVWTGLVTAEANSAIRRRNLAEACGDHHNTVDYLEHIVVMTPSLEDAIAAHEKIGVPCKRIREAGGGMRQAFFKLEQTVLEIVGPSRGAAQVWGLAFMCNDIRRAVEVARARGLQATQPKTAIQGGKIARIVDPLDGVAIAFMEPAA